MQRVGFRLSQAERGYGENYDLPGKYLLEDQKYLIIILTMHFMFDCCG